MLDGGANSLHKNTPNRHLEKHYIFQTYSYTLLYIFNTIQTYRSLFWLKGIQDINLISNFFMVQQPLVGQGFLIIKVSLSHSDTQHSVALL